MEHQITITQTLVKVVTVEASTELEARNIGNTILEKGIIPYHEYEMIEATVQAEKANNLIPFMSKTDKN